MLKKFLICLTSAIVLTPLLSLVVMLGFVATTGFSPTADDFYALLYTPVMAFPLIVFCSLLSVLVLDNIKRTKDKLIWYILLPAPLVTLLAPLVNALSW